ncbi:MAG: mechanosensitive ion channel [Deltaproteobacteria bacterium]|nr:mechanosensitive ion channel [Deltaproteobacteria bacterium]
MAWWSSVLDELLASYSAVLFAGLVLTAAMLRPRDVEERRRLRLITVLFFGHLAVAIVAGLVHIFEPELHNAARLVSAILGLASGVGMVIALVFSVLLPKVGLRTPPILRDMVGALLLFPALLVVAGRAGLSVSGLVATSTVVTAVIGLSLQDTLGNLVAGLALQSDSSIRVGDWIRFGDITGIVQEIRWRYTAVETRNWETVVIPNGQLVKNNFLILGRAKGRPVQWRRWVYFNIDFRFAPSEVTETVREALRVADLPRVAGDPAPDCILMGFDTSYGRYAVRYFLTDLRPDDPTDSSVRACIYAALKRRNIPLSIPAEARFITEESERRQARKQVEGLSRRSEVLRKIDLFRDLAPEDRLELAQSMHDAPFVKGEVLTRQGAEAHHLYLIDRGRVSVRVKADQGDREIAQLGPGEVFGEMSLMTGEQRSATVVALADVMAYRLDKVAFEGLLQERPKLAEHFAEVLAQRRIQLDAARQDLDQEARRARIATAKQDMLTKIRRFFALDSDGD